MQSNEPKFTALLKEWPSMVFRLRALLRVVGFLVLFISIPFALTGLFAWLFYGHFSQAFVPGTLVSLITVDIGFAYNLFKNDPEPIVGTLVMDAHRIVTHNQTFSLSEIDEVYFYAYTYVGKTAADSDPSDGANILTIMQHGVKHRYMYILQADALVNLKYCAQNINTLLQRKVVFVDEL